jgi:hypothetical protein
MKLKIKVAPITSSSVSAELNEANAKKMPKTIKEITEDAFRNSTSHSLPRIINAKHLLMRIVWIVASLSSVSACSFLVTTTIMEYLQYNVVTKIRVFNELESDYPGITFCNKEIVQTEKGRKIFLDYLASINITDYEENYAFNADTRYNYERAIAYLAANLNDEEKKSLGYTIEERVLFCEFNFLPCDMSYFVWYYDNEWGNCYRFNVGINSTGHSIPTIKVSSFARSTGLAITLFVANENGRIPFTQLERSEGLNVFIENSTVEPNVYESLGLATNSVSFIEVNRKFVKKMKRPFSDCQADLTHSKSPLVRYYLDNNRKYRFKKCSDLLIQDQLSKSCGCASIYFSNIHNIRYCSTEQDLECIDTNGYVSNVSHEEKALLCPEECDSVRLKLTVSASSPLSKRYINHLRTHPVVTSKFKNMSQITDEQLASSVAMFDVYYNSLSYTEIVEVPVYTIVNLISNIGGSLGLLLGMSLLSFLEFFEILFDIFMEKFNTKTLYF